MRRNVSQNEYRDPWEQGTYQTGATTPPKQHSGITALLLVAVILLAGLASMLGFLNIRLFNTLSQQKSEEVPLKLEDAAEAPQIQRDIAAVSGGVPGIGITGDALTPVYQQHFDLPEGLFITEVAEGSDAAEKGLQEGDVLMFLSGTAITDQKCLEELLVDKTIGQNVRAVVYRHSTGEKLTLDLTVEEMAE